MFDEILNNDSIIKFVSNKDLILSLENRQGNEELICDC